MLSGFVGNIIFKFMNKEARYMMALLWTNQILLGKKVYAQVPRLLKPQVKELLIDAGYDEELDEIFNLDYAS